MRGQNEEEEVWGSRYSCWTLGCCLLLHCLVFTVLTASLSSTYPSFTFPPASPPRLSLEITHLYQEPSPSSTTPVCLPTSFSLSKPLPILSVTLSLSCWLEVTGIFSQGRLCPRSGILMPGRLSGTDSSVPVGDQQTFSDSDHRPPMWIGLMCMLSLLLCTAVHYKRCDMVRKTWGWNKGGEAAGGMESSQEATSEA